jgi:hypothetical protein
LSHVGEARIRPHRLQKYLPLVCFAKHMRGEAGCSGSAPL